MLDLIARLEAAKTGDRVLDAAIAVATGKVWKDADPALVQNAVVCPDDPDWINYDYNGEECTDIAMSFTSSIDAALTLVPDECDRLINFRYGYASVWQSKETGLHGKWDATNLRNPAIALCIAALKARAALSKTGEA